MKAKTLREQTVEETQASLAAARRELLDLKVKEAARNAGRAPLKVRFLRRDIARMLTVLREREIAQ
jgi:large subunit ribosomal protein L29